MNTFNNGDRVKVKIVDKSKYAMGAGDALDGLTGAIAEVREADRLSGLSGGSLLVRFDEPAPTWWKDQTPAACFWFFPEELVRL